MTAQDQRQIAPRARHVKNISVVQKDPPKKFLRRRVYSIRLLANEPPLTSKPQPSIRIDYLRNSKHEVICTDVERKVRCHIANTTISSLKLPNTEIGSSKAHASHLYHITIRLLASAIKHHLTYQMRPHAVSQYMYVLVAKHRNHIQ